MTNTKLSDLTAWGGGTAPAGSIPIAHSGVTYRVTPAQIVAGVSGGGGDLTVTGGGTVTDVTDLVFSGATVSGSGGTATVTVSGGGGVGDVGGRVYRTNSQSIPNNTDTVVTFNAQAYASTGIHSTSVNPGRLIAPETGIYLIGYSIQFSSVATSTRRRVIVRLNEEDYIGTSDMMSGTSEVVFDILSAAFEYQMTAGDFVDFVAYQNSGDELNVRGGDVSSTNAWIRRVA
jgi:hypothetical protein